MVDPDFANPDFANPDLADILVDMDFDFDDMPNTQVSLQLFFIISFHGYFLAGFHDVHMASLA